MPRVASKITQADIARAIRAVMQTCGSAQVVFDTDGRVRVTPAGGNVQSFPVNDDEPTRVDDDGDFDL